MKVEKSIGIKIIKMSNMDDIVGEMYEATDDNQVHMLLGKDVMQVNVMPGQTRETSLMSVTPWIPFAADDEFVPIYYDSIITIVNPTPSFVEYYDNVRKRWNNSKSDTYDVIRSHADNLDEVRSPTDEELDEIEREEMMEAMFEGKKGTYH